MLCKYGKRTRNALGRKRTWKRWKIAAGNAKENTRGKLRRKAKEICVVALGNAGLTTRGARVTLQGTTSNQRVQ